MLYVIQRSCSSDLHNEVLDVKTTKQAAKVRIAEIGEQMVREARNSEPLSLDANEDGSEVYLNRAEYENEDPLYVLNFVAIKGAK